MDWEEVKDLKTLSRIKSVDEMIPKMASNQISKWWNAKIWEEQYRIIEDVLRMDGTIEEACVLAGITPTSYYNHKRSNPDFSRRMDAARQFPKLVARAAVMKRIRQWDAKTALRYLELRDKNRYNTVPWLNDNWEEWRDLPKVQFISIPSNEWADQWSNDSQTPTSANSVSDTSATSSEKQTPRENEEEALRRLDSLNFNNG